MTKEQDNAVNQIKEICKKYPYYGNLLGALKIAESNNLPKLYLKELAIRVIAAALHSWMEGYNWVEKEKVIERMRERVQLSDDDIREAIIRAYEDLVFGFEYVISFIKPFVESGMQKLRGIYHITDAEVMEAVLRAYQSAVDENYLNYAEDIRKKYDISTSPGRVISKSVFTVGGLPSYSKPARCRRRF